MSTTSHHFHQMGIGLGKRRWTGAELMPPIPSRPAGLRRGSANPLMRTTGPILARWWQRAVPGFQKEATAPTVSSLSEGGALTGAIRQRAASL
jgi:hypothetical protein